MTAKWKRWIGAGAAVAAVAGFGGAASAGTSNYDDLTEGSQGPLMSYSGVTYRDVNNVSGSFPDGGTFGPSDLGDLLIVEDSTWFYLDFPAWGSSPNTLTFGTSYVPGPNLTIGPLASAWMDLDTPATAASFDMAYYENGPWGGIVFHLDAVSGGAVVASDTLTISDLGGRDNIAVSSLSVAGATFDSLHVYATWGADYSAPRLMIDNLVITPVPAPATAGLLGLGAVALRRRRR